MDFKKKMKKFFTMTRKADGGFTLVELIVVIAILAILGGVGVPAYSGYVKKANMGADLALVSEIEHALVMAYYANPSEFNGGAIVGVSHGANAVAYDNFATKAMVAAFGEGWEQTVQLKYDGWASKNIENSNFKGIESELLDEVDYLTENLEFAINESAGENFKKFMQDNGIDSTDSKTVSNAAVLYVANNTAKLSKEKQLEVENIFAGALNSGGFDDMLANLTTAYDGDVVSAAAVMYAVAEGYSQYAGVPFSVDFTGITDPQLAGTKILNEFMALADKTGANGENAEDYITKGFVNNDVKAYMDIMSTVNGAKSQVIGSLSSLGTGSNTWSSNYSGLFTSYNNGGVLVFLEIDGNKTPISGSTLVKE